MISREQVESLLKINGMSASAPDEHIRSVLLSARYSQDEVDTALMILREDMVTRKTRIDGLHKIFRTNETLAPQEISKLLGIEVDASQFVETSFKPHNRVWLQYVFIWILSLVLAVGGIIFYMYSNQLGLFHPTLSSQIMLSI